ncbi:AAA family ATPase [Dyella sp. C11]|uniref:AAA family ATPase n=1 Tax=Dyella sp. C11 TaxID=2126991 RepID=UPI000D6442F9|nr:AAA family ATPase [Dyella sp. C11]
MKPMLLPGPVLHRNFKRARDEITELLRLSPPGKVIVLVGPTQAGKSLIFQYAVRNLSVELQPKSPAHIPFVHLVVATSQDGRISPKYLTLRLLKLIRHPMHEHVGDFDESDHYRPSRGRDETSLRLSLELGMIARETLLALLDEAHHLTHTKDRELRSNVLQSIKCLGAIDRTLALFGGYELVYRGLFDSAHFAGRLICVEIAPYTNCPDDLIEWSRILKLFGKHMSLHPPSLLLEEVETLLYAANGVFGLLEKILWLARARSHGKAITREVLRSAFPTQAEHDVIKRDIEAGQRAIARLRNPSFDTSASASTPRTKQRRRPFQRNPNRKLPTYPKVSNE